MTNVSSNLLSHSIKHMYIEPGEHILCFVCEDGTVVEWKAEGDCCSETWFADILNPEAIMSGGAVVLEVNEIPFVPASTDGRCRQESDQFYGMTISTLLGTCTIIYRNSSNGYYGGSYKETINYMPNSDPVFYSTWKEIKSDWQA